MRSRIEKQYQRLYTIKYLQHKTNSNTSAWYKILWNYLYPNEHVVKLKVLKQ